MTEDHHNEAESQPAGGTFEKLGKALDERPEVQAAEEALAHARDQLEKAQQVYEDLREKASQRWQTARESKLGDLVDETLTFVRKNPGKGLLLALASGFFLGKFFRR